MSRLEEQLEELEVLQAMFFSPGEFEIKIEVLMIRL